MRSRYAVFALVALAAMTFSATSGAGTCRQFSLQLNDGTPPHTAVFQFFS